MSLLKKSIFIIFMLIAIPNYSQNQKTLSVLFGINNINSTSYGGEIFYLTNLYEKLHMRFSFGYYDFPGRKKLNEESFLSDFSSIIEADKNFTLSVGGRYYLSEKDFKPYFDLIYELDYFTNTLEYDRIVIKPGQIGDKTKYETSYVRNSDPILKTSLGWSLGFQQKIAQNLSLDLMVGQRFISGYFQSLRLLAGFAYTI